MKSVLSSCIGNSPLKITGEKIGGKLKDESNAGRLKKADETNAFFACMGCDFVIGMLLRITVPYPKFITVKIENL